MLYWPNLRPRSAVVKLQKNICPHRGTYAMHLHGGTRKIKLTYCDETKKSVIDCQILSKL